LDFAITVALCKVMICSKRNEEKIKKNLKKILICFIFHLSTELVVTLEILSIMPNIIIGVVNF
jgi:hypothetical protein